MSKKISMTKTELVSYLNGIVGSYINLRIALQNAIDDPQYNSDMKRAFYGAIASLTDMSISVLDDMRKRKLIDDKLEPLLENFKDEREQLQKIFEKKKMEKVKKSS